MVKVAFDGQLFLKGNKTGIGWCADNLVKGIAETEQYECQLNYFSRGYSEEELKLLNEYENCGIRLNSCTRLTDVWYKLIWPFIKVPYCWFFRGDCQITHFFNYVIPPGVRGKKVTIVYDMAYLACPETVSRKTRWWLKLTLKQSCKRADAIITISEFSKRELIKYLNVPEEKIHVMYLGVDFELYHPNYSDEQVESVRKKYGIEPDYFLYLGTIEPRKNLVRLLKAYGKLAKQMPNIPQLVLAGGKGWLSDEIYLTAEKLNLGKKILFTGYVDKQEAPILMKGAYAFLFPSIYEGFGMPVVEAMACGTPVITADSTSLKEIAEGAAFLVESESIESIYAGIKKITIDSVLRDKLIELGLERASTFSWKKATNIVDQVYKGLLE